MAPAQIPALIKTLTNVERPTDRIKTPKPIPINVEGIEFMMTALFITTFIEQWKGTDHHFPAILGLGASLMAVFVFGPSNFILPAMIVILIGNLYYRRKYVN